jgi:hypothetical protein
MFRTVNYYPQAAVLSRLYAAEGRYGSGGERTDET